MSYTMSYGLYQKAQDIKNERLQAVVIMSSGLVAYDMFYTIE